MDAEISDFAYFFNKGENARKYCIYNIKLGSGHVQNDEKSIRKRCEIDAGKSNAKSIENHAKTNSKRTQIPFQDRKKARHIRQKQGPKIDAKEGPHARKVGGLGGRSYLD